MHYPNLPPCGSGSNVLADFKGENLLGHVRRYANPLMTRLDHLLTVTIRLAMSVWSFKWEDRVLLGKERGEEMAVLIPPDNNIYVVEEPLRLLKLQ